MQKMMTHYVYKLKDLGIFEGCTRLSLSGEFLEGRTLQVRYYDSVKETKMTRKVFFSRTDGLFVRIKGRKLFPDDFMIVLKLTEYK